MSILKNISKAKLVFSLIVILGSPLISLKFYSNQNFQEYTKLSITYNNRPFESHRNFIKLFRNLENYKFWIRNENPTAEIFDFVSEGSYSSESGYSTNSNLEFPKLRNTEATYFIVIKKTSNENLKSLKEYIEFSTNIVEEKYKKNFPLYNIAVSYPSPYYRIDFKPLAFYVIGSLFLGLFLLAILFFLYEEVKSSKLLK